jgi:hypothetical protein
MRCTNEHSVKTSFVYTVEGGLGLSTFYPTISQMKPVFDDILLIWMSNNSHYIATLITCSEPSYVQCGLHELIIPISRSLSGVSLPKKTLTKCQVRSNLPAFYEAAVSLSEFYSEIMINCCFTIIPSLLLWRIEYNSVPINSQSIDMHTKTQNIVAVSKADAEL